MLAGVCSSWVLLQWTIARQNLAVLSPFFLFQFIWMPGGLHLHHTFCYRDWSPLFAHWSPVFISGVYWHYLPFNTLLEILLLLVLMLPPLYLAVTVPGYWSKKQWFWTPFLLFSLPFLLQTEFRHLNLSAVLLWVWGWLGGTKPRLCHFRIWQNLPSCFQ